MPVHTRGRRRAGRARPHSIVDTLTEAGLKCWADKAYQAAEAVRALLARAEPGVRADLLLDMGTVLADRPDASKEALRALDALVPVASWHSASVLSGGFPRVRAEMLDQGLREEPRRDWALWHEIARSRREPAPWLRPRGGEHRRVSEVAECGQRPARGSRRPHPAAAPMISAPP
ncbi:beta family protein [Streptomyces termitum]|uniref:beta family protein n=1 Tax=Streptomyces termitum TaxID=67368 RepID=UPI0033A70DAB